MPESHKISLLTAIFINMNIMIGAGVFVNTIPLAKMAGILSPLIYLLVGLLILPLVISISRLLKIHPGGTFYTFGAREINPLMGFISAWGYFVGKLASATLMIHFAALIIQNTFTDLKSIPTVGIDLGIITLFTILNTLNMRIGSRIQMAFVLMKNIPILFIIFSGLILFNFVNIDTAINLGSIPLSIPLIIYAFAGFEASCSLSAHIQNSEKNAPKALLISFFCVSFIYAAYQFMFYSIVGAELGNLSHYFEIFPALISKIMPHSGPMALKIQAVLQLAIALSSLGSGYGVLFSNSWNLYAVAKHSHLPGSALLSSLNQHGVAQICLIVEALIATAYILITWGSPIPLQQIGAFCSILAYTISVVALWMNAYRQKNRTQLIVPSLGLISCLALAGTCLYGFTQNGTYAPGLFFGLLILGVILFYWQKRPASAA